jgi:hypothetical protein
MRMFSVNPDVAGEVMLCSRPSKYRQISILHSRRRAAKCAENQIHIVNLVLVYVVFIRIVYS